MSTANSTLDIEIGYCLGAIDQLNTLFSSTSTWLQGQLLAEQIIAEGTEPKAVEAAKLLLAGHWPNTIPGTCSWPARDETVYLKHWCPVMAFGVAEQIHRDRLDAVEAYAWLHGPRDDSRVAEQMDALSAATQTQIDEIKAFLAA